MDTRVETALLASLERLEAGRTVDAGWVRRKFPGCERDVLDFVGLHRRLERGRPPHGRVGPYRLLRRLGRGGMGTVFLARDGDGRSVAVKVLHASVTGAPGGVERVLAEARAGTAVQHRNLLRLLDCGVHGRGDGARAYLVFEAVTGQTLRGLLDDFGTVPETRARHVGAEVADALASIHAAGLVHGDVKPENVILGTDQSVRLLDLGAVRGCPASRDAAEDLFVGSMLYAAPEQLGPGPEPIDGRADLYALGIVLYELVTGRHPFGRARFPDDPSKSLPVPRPRRLSAFLACVLDNLLALDRADRLARAEQLRDLLRQGERSAYWRGRLHARTGEPRRLRGTTPLRGRDPELSALHCAVSEGRTVLVEGGAGIGKSRLVEEIVSHYIEGKERRLLHAGFAEGDALAAALRPHVAGRTLPLDARSVAILDAYACGTPLPAEANRAELHAAVAQLLATLSRDNSVLVVIDDLHLAGADGRALFEHIVRTKEKAVALIATARPELPSAWRDELLACDAVSTLSLGSLGPGAVRRLVTDLLGGAPSERLVSWCTDQSRGHPLLAREAISWIRAADGRLTDASGIWDLLGDVESVPPSESVREVMRARLDKLTPPVRDVLDAAACGGLQFDTQVLATVLGSPVGALSDQLKRIEFEHGLVVSVGTGFAFDHQLVREVLHEDLYPALRRQLHHVWAEGITSCAGKIEGPAAVELVSHWLEAGRTDAALEALAAAVAHLDHAVRPHAALGLIERVLDALGDGTLAERVPLLRQRAQRLMQLGRFDALDETLEEAWAIAHHAAPLERAYLHDLNAKRTLLAGKPGTVQREVEQALALAAQASEVPPALEASLAHSQARAAWLVGRAADAHGLFDRAAELARAAGALELESQARAMAAQALAYTVPPQESFAACEEADAFARTHGSALTRAIGRRTYGRALWRVGRPAESIPVLEDALDLCARSGDRATLPTIESDLSRVLANLGRFEESRVHAESAARGAAELGVPGVIAYANVGKGDLLMELGEFDAAASAFLSAARVLRRQGAPSFVECVSRVAGARAAQGRYREALGAYEHASKGMCDTQFSRVAAGFRIEFAEACLAAGRLDRANELASAARPSGGGGLDRLFEAKALAIEAACAWQRDDPSAENLTTRALQCAGASPPLRLDVFRTAVGGWMAFRRPDAAATLALRVAAEATDCLTPWLRALPLALAARSDRDAAETARALLRKDGQRLPLLDRIAAHAHLWFADGDEGDRAAARGLLPAVDSVVDLARADPAIARIAD
ncbi:MAG: protein kinase domain-containing protein [Planctomycetota bacterium]|jgi:tetratricopeptide (TPR) repeat protein